MATLPQAQDYGRRVQLRDNRIDIPGSGEMAVANSLERAAANFTQMAVEHKQKDDALKYSNAKNEYLIADMQEREKLKHDPDFETHNQRYEEAMKGHYERLFPTITSARDRALFDAEAGLMNARGGIAVGDNARTKEIDWNIGKFAEHTEAMKRIAVAAPDAQTAQDALFSILEQATALRDKGYLGQAEYQEALQSATTDVALARLLGMDPEDRVELLERSITMTRSKGEPITREDIAAGKGSGSIADFLPLDVRVRLLKESKDANEHDINQARAYEIFDAAEAIHKDAANLHAALMEAGKGEDPEVRAALRTLSAQYGQDQNRNEAIRRDNIMVGAQERMNQGQDPETMSGDDWALLHPTQQKALKEEWISRLQRDGFGRIDVMWTAPDDTDHVVMEDGSIMLGGAAKPSYSLWRSFSAQEKAGLDLDESRWRQAFTQKTWQDLKDEQADIQSALAAGQKFQESNVLTPMQRVNAALVNMGRIPQTDRSEEDQQVYWTTVRNFDAAIRDAERIKGGKLTHDEENAILGELLRDKAFSDNYWFGWGASTDEDEMDIIATMPPDQLNRARVPLSASQIIMVEGLPVTHEQKLKQMAVDADIVADRNSISQKNLERANFALINLIGTDGTRYNPATITPDQMEDVNDEIKRRLKGN